MHFIVRSSCGWFTYCDAHAVAHLQQCYSTFRLSVVVLNARTDCAAPAELDSVMCTDECTRSCSAQFHPAN
jgi:hypothetical protein